MRWEDERRSDNVEDQRGLSLPGGGIRIGGCSILLILIISLLTGQNPLRLFAVLFEQQQQQTPQATAPEQPGQPPANDKQTDFVRAILGSTEDTWTELFNSMNRNYVPPKLVLFSNEAQSGCGFASAAVGPFYCSADDKVYLDLTFFRELDQRFGASGDFAQAYVIAHEVGHHVQNLLGITDRVQRMQEQGGNENTISVRMELQADCFAGVWGNHADKERHLLETGDVEEGINAAAAVGDDRIQQSAGRAITPETWTHGSSKMRVTWFKRGFESGDVSSCDTFQQ
jgi:predicted metalloprotease